MRWTALALVLVLQHLPVAARELNLPKPPSDLDMTWVVEYMEFNDLPMSIRSFNSSESIKALVPRLTEYMESLGEEVLVTTDQEGWTVLATADDENFYSLKLQEGYTSTGGVFAVSSKFPPKNTGKTQTRLPLGFLQIEKQKFFDGPHIQEFTVLSTNSGQSAALVSVEQMLIGEGWQTTRDTRAIRYFSRGRERATVTSQPGEQGVGTLILISKELAK